MSNTQPPRTFLTPKLCHLGDSRNANLFLGNPRDTLLSGLTQRMPPAPHLPLFTTRRSFSTPAGSQRRRLCRWTHVPNISILRNRIRHRSRLAGSRADAVSHHDGPAAHAVRIRPLVDKDTSRSLSRSSASPASTMNCLDLDSLVTVQVIADENDNLIAACECRSGGTAIPLVASK